MKIKLYNLYETFIMEVKFKIAASTLSTSNEKPSLFIHINQNNPTKVVLVLLSNKQGNNEIGLVSATNS